MTDYIIVHADSMRALVERVNERLKEGYRPQGGIASVKALENTFLMQAMAK